MSCREPMTQRVGAGWLQSKSSSNGLPPVARRMGILLPKEGYVSLAARQFVSFLRQEAEAVEK